MAVANKVGYLDVPYRDEGNVIRHGDRLRDIQLDMDANTRVLGLIGRNDATGTKDNVLFGIEALAYLVMERNKQIIYSHLTYDNKNVKFYGLDLSQTNTRQAIRVEAYGFSCLSVMLIKAS